MTRNAWEKPVSIRLDREDFALLEQCATTEKTDIVRRAIRLYAWQHGFGSKAKARKAAKLKPLRA